jgi:sodium transport system permease protein
MKGVWLVFKKEILEFTKDRKTMFFTLAMPIILYPLMFGMIGKLGQREEREARSKPTRIALIDPSSVLEPLVRPNTEDFEMVPAPDGDAGQAIRNDELEMLVTLEPEADKDLAEHRTTPIDVLYNRVETSGRIGMQRLQNALKDFDGSTIQARLQQLGQSSEFAVPTQVNARQVGGNELVLAKLLGTMLPYILMIMLFMGSMQLGVYVTAGERERGTLITLLATGLPRREIIWGKLLYIFCMGIVNSIINIGAMAFAMGSMLVPRTPAPEAGAQMSSFAAVADPAVILLTVLLMIPLGLLFSNMIIFLGIQAKNTQEAGTAMMPIVLLVLFLAIFSMSPGIEKMGVLPYIPIVNVSLVIRKLFVQQASAWEYLVTFIMTVGLAALLTYISTKFLNRESAIFKST